MRGDQLVFQSGCALIRPCWHADVNVGISEEEFGVHVRGHQVVGFEDLFKLGIDKIVERIDVLLDKTFAFKVCGQ